ncbi:hypothetical protein C8F04DRAFT_1270523 [Mycena alexandri]|uniref:Uncharacterized protein n=1 Tax=Mycena alexandri TaxID=1745969 RepID=A0AAD6SB01_9AGAR|nr:hypothetical protein C8F04DRAFT_1270523 [Mycena alexandri]
MALPNSTSTSSSASERARRAANRSGSVPTTDTTPTVQTTAQPSLPPVTEADATMSDAQDANIVASTLTTQTQSAPATPTAPLTASATPAEPTAAATTDTNIANEAFVANTVPTADATSTAATDPDFPPLAHTDAVNGASSSRLPADPNSPPKRQRADSRGRAVSTSSDPDADEPALDARPRRAPRPNPHLTVDGNPPQASYAPTPRGGHRTIFGVTTESLLGNLPARQRAQWDEVEHPKLLATVSGGNGDRIATWEAFRRHIAGRFNMDPEDISIGTPGLGERAGPDPAAWLIGGLSLEQGQALIDMGALVSDTMTTIFHAYRPFITGFATTFQGFTIAARNRDLAHAVIADAIMADTAVIRYVRSHRDAIPPFLSNDEALARFGESIRVQSIQLLSPRGPFTAWNVYVDSPTNSEEHFAELARLIGNIVIDTPFNGQGRPYHRPLHCNICGGRDHPTNLCPLVDTPGYCGPTPETIGALLEASREALNPKGKKSGRWNGNPGGNGKGKGKDRDDRKGGNGRKGGRGQ